MIDLRKRLLGELLCPLDKEEVKHRELICASCECLVQDKCTETGWKVSRNKRPEAKCPKNLWQSKGKLHRDAKASIIQGRRVAFFTSGFGLDNFPANLLKDQIKRLYNVKLNVLSEMTEAVALHPDFAAFYAFNLTTADVIWIDPNVFFFEPIPLFTEEAFSAHRLPAPFPRFYPGLFAASRKFADLFEQAKDEDTPELGWQLILKDIVPGELKGLFFPLRDSPSATAPSAVALETDAEASNRLLQQMHISPRPWREVCRHFKWAKELTETDPYPAGTKIALDCAHAGIGDLLDVAHVVEGIRHENPEAIVTVHPKEVKESFTDLYGLTGPIELGAIIHKLPPTPWHKLDDPSRIENWAVYCGASKPRIATPVIGKSAEAFADDFLKGPTVCLSPISTCPTRSWPLERYEALGHLLEGAGWDVVIIDEPEGTKTVRSPFKRLFNAGAEREAAVIRRSALLVGNDSGMAHLSSGLGVPTLVLCGPTDGKSVFGWYEKTRWIDGQLPCSGCYWYVENDWRTECEHGCMAILRISIKEVFRKSLELLPVLRVV